jgi:hypothetical protein
MLQVPPAFCPDRSPPHHRSPQGGSGHGESPRVRFVVDLGGLAGAANPLHVPLSGPAANAVTRAYHLSAMSGNRMRVLTLTDWTLNGITFPDSTSLAVIGAESVPLDAEKPRA